MTFKFILPLLLLIICQGAFSDTYKAEKITEINGVLWGFTFVDNEKVVLNSRKGKMYLYNLKTKAKTELTGLPENIYSKGQGGLLDAFYYKEWLFFTYAFKKKDDAYYTVLAKAKIGKSKLENLTTLLVSTSESDESHHFGSRVVIKNDEVYFSVGDRGQREKAQNLKYHNGKILRLTLEGKAFKGNPFEKNGEVEKYIFSYGHRNPQGLCLDGDNTLYEVEMGPRGGDEINIPEKGKNYGWPTITYGKEYWGPSIGGEKKEGMEQPLKYYVPSISPSGCAFLTKDFYPEFKGNLFLANLSGEHLRRIEIKDKKIIKEEEMFKEMDKRFRSVKEAPNGELYFSTDDGELFKLVKLKS